MTTYPVSISSAAVTASCISQMRSLTNIRRSGSSYLIATTFPDPAASQDIVDGEWRPINLQAKPFDLPQPQELIREGLTESSCCDKSLALWRVSDVIATGTLDEVLCGWPNPTEKVET